MAVGEFERPGIAVTGSHFIQTLHQVNFSVHAGKISRKVSRIFHSIHH